MVSVMSSHYKLYALGLDEAGNESFKAWVEPCASTNPAEKIGTTVSARVVGADMHIDALGLEQV